MPKPTAPCLSSTVCPCPAPALPARTRADRRCRRAEWRGTVGIRADWVISSICNGISPNQTDIGLSRPVYRSRGSVPHDVLVPGEIFSDARSGFADSPRAWNESPRMRVRMAEPDPRQAGMAFSCKSSTFCSTSSSLPSHFRPSSAKRQMRRHWARPP